jgi:hypothetical protein
VESGFQCRGLKGPIGVEERVHPQVDGGDGGNRSVYEDAESRHRSSRDMGTGWSSSTCYNDGLPLDVNDIFAICQRAIDNGPL